MWVEINKGGLISLPLLFTISCAMWVEINKGGLISLPLVTNGVLDT
jgi:hypothetical protein